MVKWYHVASLYQYWAVEHDFALSNRQAYSQSPMASAIYPRKSCMQLCHHSEPVSSHNTKLRRAISLFAASSVSYSGLVFHYPLPITILLYFTRNTQLRNYKQKCVSGGISLKAQKKICSMWKERRRVNWDYFSMKREKVLCIYRIVQKDKSLLFNSHVKITTEQIWTFLGFHFSSIRIKKLLLVCMERFY